MEDTTLLLSRKEAARALSLSLRTIDELIRRKQLPARRFGKRVLIPRVAVEKFADVNGD